MENRKIVAPPVDIEAPVKAKPDDFESIPRTDEPEKVDRPQPPEVYDCISTRPDDARPDSAGK